VVLETFVGTDGEVTVVIVDVVAVNPLDVLLS
jgi:hypothetical protein